MRGIVKENYKGGAITKKENLRGKKGDRQRRKDKNNKGGQRELKNGTPKGGRTQEVLSPPRTTSWKLRGGAR